MPNKRSTHRAALHARSHGLVAGLLLALVCVMAGCREHPRVTSSESLSLIKRLYTACNTRNSVRLTQCQQEFDQLAQASKLSPAEQAAFGRIFQMASSGQWDAAQTSSLQFARDQIK